MRIHHNLHCRAVPMHISAGRLPFFDSDLVDSNSRWKTKLNPTDEATTAVSAGYYAPLLSRLGVCEPDLSTLRAVEPI